MSLSITLQGVTHAVVLPRRYAETREIVHTSYASAFRGAGAALAYCVPTLKIRAALPAYRGDVAEFGAAAWEELHARGISDPEMITAAQPIIDALVEKAFPTTEEVAETEVFSGQPAAGQTTKP